MPSILDLVEVDQIAESLFRPRARCLEDLPRENAYGDRDGRDRTKSVEIIGLILPVDLSGGGACFREPVQRDIVQHLVSCQHLFRLLVTVSPGDELVVHPSSHANGRVDKRVTDRLWPGHHHLRVTSVVLVESRELVERSALLLAKTCGSRIVDREDTDDLLRHYGRHVQVNAKEARYVLMRHTFRNDGAAIAALGNELVVTQAVHESAPGPGSMVGAPTRHVWLSRKTEPRDRRYDQMESIVLRSTMCGRIGERVNDLEHFKNRTRPAVGHDKRQRVLMLRANVDEVDVEAVDLGDEHRQRVELRFDLPPVVPVRRAIAHAIDLNVILNTVWYGYGHVSPTPISTFLPQYLDTTIKPYAFDLKAAEQLLDEAGYKRNGGGIRFTLRLTHNSYNEGFKRVAEYLKQNLARIGIDARIDSYDFSTYIQKVYIERAFDLAAEYLGNQFDPTLGVQRIYWSKNFKLGLPFSNASHYQNPEVDRLLEAASVEVDEAKRKQEFNDFQKIIADELPVINLIALENVTVFNKRVRNHTIGAEGVQSNFADVYIKENEG